MGWLRLVGSLKVKVFFAKEPCRKDDILQKRRIILRTNHVRLYSERDESCAFVFRKEDPLKVMYAKTYTHVYTCTCVFRRKVPF